MVGYARSITFRRLILLYRAATSNLHLGNQKQQRDANPTGVRNARSGELGEPWIQQNSSWLTSSDTASQTFILAMAINRDKLVTVTTDMETPLIDDD